MHIKSFQFYDKQYEKIRTFISAPLINKVTNLSREYFLEVIFVNVYISLLGRESIDITKYNSTTKYQHNKTLINKNYQRFLLEMDTKNLSILLRQSLLSIVKDDEKEVLQFIKSNKLKMKKNEDYQKVIEYYSLLKKSVSNQL